MSSSMMINAKMKNRAAAGGLVVGAAAALTLLVASPLKAQGLAATRALVVPQLDADSVDYRAGGVSYQQFGKAAKALAESTSSGAPPSRWVFTRAFAWAAYEYTYNRPNYDRWIAQLGDGAAREIMQSEVQEYVAAGRPPIANPMSAANDAVVSYNAYRLSVTSVAGW